jgi:hypothetical protein
MVLDASHNGDVTKVDGGAFLAAALSADEERKFLGFYALTSDATYVRGANQWNKARGDALYALNGAQLVEMEKLFVNTFDRLERAGETPSLEHVAKGSTKGASASWDEQEKRHAEKASKK